MLIEVEKFNEVYMRVFADAAITNELAEYFTFRVEGYRFMPAYKSGRWDGNIRLYNKITGTLYVGLLPILHTFADNSNYTIQYNSEIIDPTQIPEELIQTFIDNLNIHSNNNKIDVRDYQFNSLVYAINNKRAIIESPTGCQKGTDKVLMYNGQWKQIKDIQLGEYVIGKCGSPKSVLRLFSGIDDMYEIIPTNGSTKITTTSNHILPLKSDNNDTTNYLSVKEYIDKHYMIKHTANLMYNKNIITFKEEHNPDTKLSPYFIGMYISVGTRHNYSIVTINNQIINEIYQQAEKLGCPVINDHNIEYTINDSNNILQNEFRKLGIPQLDYDNKFIPQGLLLTTPEFRVELLAGILDSGGAVYNFDFLYTTNSYQLVEDLITLAVSLGLRTHIERIYKTDYYDIIIGGDTSILPLKIFSNDLKIPFYKQPYQSKFNINPLGKDVYCGIEVEDHLYITNDGMITHNSGKSLLIYALIRWYIAQNIKCLIIVPTVQLVEQLYKDFEDYSSHNNWDVEDNVGQIYSGKDKYNTKNCVISTYQSLIKLPKKWFNDFVMCVTDEVHNADTKSISTIMSYLVNAKYRFGTTGTLKETKTSVLTLQGMFGSVYKPISTKELMDNKTLAQLSIKAMLLEYSPETCKELNIICRDPITKKYDYQKEVHWLVTNNNRNNFIANLTVFTKGNTLVLFQFVDKHGKVLYDMINQLLASKDNNRKTFFIHGGVDIKDREIMRETLSTNTDVIVVASYQTLSTGINAPSIQNIILASPTKSKIRLLQSIGRSLRIKDAKTTATIYDIGDKLKYRNHTNFSLLHFIDRLKLYNTEEFDYKLLNIKIK